MEGTGKGTSSNSSFEMVSEMELEETEDSVLVHWRTETEVFGRVAQFGQRVLNPVANRVVNQFFSSVTDQVKGIEEGPSGLRDRIGDYF